MATAITARPRSVTTVFFSLLCVGAAAEGIWLFVAAMLSGPPYPLAFLGLIGLWLFVIASLFWWRSRPALMVLACWANFIGCALLKTEPMVKHRIASFLYTHSVDIAMILFAHLSAYYLRRKITS